tara:strand:+ start:2733 stop:3674 length:942 start_codon:yes stop_codon:yes gene_type:complete
MIDKNLALLQRFAVISEGRQGSIPYSIFLGDEQSEKKAFICAAAHGNEVGSLPAVLKFIEDVISGKKQIPIQLQIAIGNIEAIRINQRYVEEDMNRAYNIAEPKSVDALRAKEIATLIQWSDVFLDLHQTIEETEGSFYVLRKDPISLDLARALGLSKHAIVIDSSNKKPGDSMTATEYGKANNSASVTLELGQKGYDTAAETLSYQSIEKFVDFYSQHNKDEFIYEAQKSDALTLLEVKYSHPFESDQMRLIEGLKNLNQYKKGELLGYNGDKEILAPFDGYIFFPKYIQRDKNGRALEKLPEKLFLFARQQ